MAKKTQRITCLFAWLRDRKEENGLTRKRSKKDDEEDEQRKIFRAMNRLVMLLVICIFMSCGQSREELRQEQKQKSVDSMEKIIKRQTVIDDSILWRLESIESFIKDAGVSRKEAERLTDSINREEYNYSNQFEPLLNSIPVMAN